MVVLGNMMCELIDHAHHERQPFLTEIELRQIVALAARRFGQEELCVVANHLTAEAMPPDASEEGYADFYIADKDETRAYPQLIAERVAEVLGALEYDRFDGDHLLAFAERARDLIDTRAEAVDVMWQHGLLGYIEGPSILDGRVVFYSAAHEDRLRLPRNKPGYALHAIMVDTIDELRGLGQPVHPY